MLVSSPQLFTNQTMNSSNYNDTNMHVLLQVVLSTINSLNMIHSLITRSSHYKLSYNKKIYFKIIIILVFLM